MAFLNLGTTMSKSSTILKVGIIDTGIYAGHEFFKNIKIVGDTDDYHGHGTSVASVMLKDTCDGVIVYSCRVRIKGLPGKSYEDCLKWMERQNVDLLNLSMADNGSGKDDVEDEFVRNFEGRIIVAAGNEGINLDAIQRYPAQYGKIYKKVLTIGSLREDGKMRHRTSNYGSFVYWQIGENVPVAKKSGGWGVDSGTSFATPSATNKHIKAWCAR